jgi:hypothetical protein
LSLAEQSWTTQKTTLEQQVGDREGEESVGSGGRVVGWERARKRERYERDT